MSTEPASQPLAPLAQRLRSHGVTWALVLGVPVLAALLGLVGLPAGADPVLGPLTVLESLLGAGLLAGGYWAGGVGLAGPLAAVWSRGAASPSTRWWMQLALGVAIMPWLSHLAAWLGLFAGVAGRFVAITVLIAGAAMLLVQLVRAMRARPALTAPHPIWLAALLPLAVLLVAACNPPGILWRSEAGGFDALSYHLQLPQEWARSGRLAPLEHNVYSFLPSHMEAAFTHLSVVLGGGMTPPGRPGGLLLRDGAGLAACQLLHALTALFAAMLLGRAVSGAARAGGLDGSRASIAGALAAACLLALPWTTVCGSLAYNELALAACFAGAVMIAGERGLRPAARGAACGLLTAAAVSFKPSGAFMIAPMIGMLLLAGVPVRAWWRCVAAGIVAGSVVLAPWLARNALASGGNPVFPAATGALGSGHWSAEQATRFHLAHTPALPVSTQALLLVSPRGDPASVDDDARGFLHRQWGLLFPAALAMTAAAMSWRPARLWSGVALISIAAGCAWWIGFSHAQSRFLLPLAVPLSGLCGLGVAAMARLDGEGSGGPRRLAIAAAACIPLFQQALGFSIWLSQSDWRPNQGLAFGVSVFTGADARTEYARATADRQRQIEADLSPTGYVNLAIPATDRVYLLGDSAPLYYLGRIVYHTTWDRSPLGTAIAAGGGPEAWTAELRKSGIDWVLVNEPELRRLWASGWYDPAVTDEAVRRWMRSLGEPVRHWTRQDGASIILFRLRGARAEGNA